MPDGYLPPIVVDILGDNSNLVKKVEEATGLKVPDKEVKFNADASRLEAEAEAIARQQFEGPTFRPKMDTSGLAAEIGLADSLVGNRGVVANNIAKQMLADKLASAASLGGLSRPLLNDYASMAGVADAAAMRNKSAVISSLVAADMATQTGGAGKGGGGGGLGALLGGAFAGAGGAALWGGGTGLAAALLSPIRAIGTMFSAGLGTVGSFAGFGPEHLLTTALGLGGSAIGGGLGAGLLGLGTLGVAGVGMGTDMAGIGQAGGDIKMMNTDYNNLNQAIAEYGKQSTQAHQAQAQVNYDLHSFSPVARSAVVSAVGVIQAFKAMFDQWTGAAEGTGAQIITQGIQVAMQFLPTIGKFAATNMVIIQQGLQPLFKWLGGPGLKIFQDLEQEFTNNLPIAMDAFVQGIELIIKTIDVASHYTGGFILKLDEFLTKANSPVGFAKWSADIGKLIGDFHLWDNFIKAVIKDIYLLFSNDAGTAKSILVYLTEMLNKLGAWEASTQGKSELHNIFEVHKQEILELLKLLPSLISSFGRIYLTVAPALTHAVTVVLEHIVPFLNAMSKNPAGAWILGLSLLAAKFGILQAAFKTAGGGLVEWLGAGPVGLIIAGLAILGIALYELITHFKQVTAFLKGPWGQAIEGALAAYLPFLGLPLEIYTHWAGFSGFFKRMYADVVQWADDAYRGVDGAWQTIDRDTRNWFGNTLAFIASVWRTITGTIEGAALAVYHFLDSIWQTVDRDTRNWFGNVENFFLSLPGNIMKALSSLPTLMLNFGIHIMQMLLRGIGSVATSIGGTLLHDITAHLPKSIGGVKLPGGLASGTNFAQGGMTWVGEKGPELVNLPRGSQVFPANQSARMGGGTVVNVYVQSNANAKEIGNEVAWAASRRLAGLGHVG